MGLNSLFNTLRRQQQHQSDCKRSLRRLPQKRALRLEPLEDRRLLSAGGVETAEQAMEVFEISPALFVENQGQWENTSIQYAFFGDGANVLHTDTGPVFQLFRQEEIEETAPTDDPFETHALWEEPAEVATEQTKFSVRFDGALAVNPVGLDQGETVHNYFVGDQANWRSGVPTFETVGYQGLYEGIDLYTWGQRDSLKYEFHVAPGSDYRQIQVSYEGIDGLWLDDGGALHVETALGELVDDAPYIYQEIGGEAVGVSGMFELVDGDTYAFTLTGVYDPAVELIIDPNLAWSTYLGGDSDDLGMDIDVDASGNVLVTGRTQSSGWVSDGFDLNHDGSMDVFVAKLDSDGVHLWSTYLGGSNDDYSNGVAVDAYCNVLVTGLTYSSSWVSGGFDTNYKGSGDIFVAKLDPAGAHLWSAYLGGPDTDAGFGIVVDNSGHILVTGSTCSSGWVSDGFDLNHGGSMDVFVAKLDSDGVHLWSTYLGGSNDDYSKGVAVDASSNVLVTGSTYSSSWVSGGFDMIRGGTCDAFVAKLSPIGVPLWSTYLGMTGTNYGNGIAVDISGNSVVTGGVWVDRGYSDGGYDAFVTKLSSTGEHLWSNYVVGRYSEDNKGRDVAMDAFGNALVTGEIHSGSSAFVKKFDPDGVHLWSIDFGGSDGDLGDGIAMDASGSALITGRTWSTDFQYAHNTYHGRLDAFVAKIDGAGTPWDIDDTLLQAQNLGPLASEQPLTRYAKVGDGNHGDKDVDIYRFELAQPGVVHIDVDAGSIGSPLDAYLRLFDSSGSSIAASDDVDDWDPYISLSLAPGTYYVGVSGSPNRYYDPDGAGSGTPSDTTGEYQLRIAVDGAGSGSWEPLVMAEAEYDGNPAPGVFGRYLTGSVVDDVWNTFTVLVQAPTGYTTSTVTFDANFNGVRDAGDYSDSSAQDGWTWDLNVSDLSGDKTLSIWAQESGGTWSDVATVTIETQAAPDWLNPDLTVVSFNAPAGKYEVSSLIGVKYGEYTPSDWPFIATDPDGNPTWSGLYAGVELTVDYGLDGKVGNEELAAVLGLSLFSSPLELRYELTGREGRLDVPLDTLFTNGKIQRSHGGWFNIQEINADRRMKKAQRENGYYSKKRGVEYGWNLAFTWSGLDLDITDDLAFGSLSGTVGVEAGVSGKLPKIGRIAFGSWNSPPFPPVMPILNAKITPSLGFGFSLDADFAIAWDGEAIAMAGSSITFTPEMELAVTGEVQLAYGAASAGLKASGTVGLGVNGIWTEEDGWTATLKPSLQLKLSAIYSLVYGLFSGEYPLLEWPNNSNNTTAMADNVVLPDIAFGDVMAGVNGSATAIYIPVLDTGSSQQVLIVDRNVGGGWSTVQELSGTTTRKESPVLRALPDGRMLAVWVESTIPEDLLPAPDDPDALATVLGSQELRYAVRDVAGTWSAPMAVTANSVLDDSPALAVSTSGETMLVWRKDTSNDPYDSSTSDLYFALWDGAAWGPEQLLENGTAGYLLPSVSYGQEGTAVAAWVEDKGSNGQDGVVRAAVFDGMNWSTSSAISETTPIWPRMWPSAVTLSDGRSLFFWVEHRTHSEGLSDGYTLLCCERSNGSFGAANVILENWDLIDRPRIAVSDGDQVHVMFHALGESNEIYVITRDYALPGDGWSEPKSWSGGATHSWLPMGDAGSVLTLFNTGDLFGTTDDADPLLAGDANLPLHLAGTRAELAADFHVDGGTVNFVNGAPRMGEPNPIEVVIANSGWLSGTADVQLYDGDPEDGGSLVDTLPTTLPVGESSTITLRWTPLEEGTYVLYVVADLADTLDELREDNNVATTVVDVLVPPTVELAPASDTGTPSDGRTSDFTPTFIGTATPGTLVQIFVDDDKSPSGTAIAYNTSYSVTVSELANGDHTISARIVNSEGYVSAFSAPIEIFIDAATLPSPGTPRLDEDSDTGTIGDGITSVRRPEIVGTAKPLSDALLYDNSTFLGEATADSDGNFSFVPPEDLSLGLHEISVRQTDDSGNASDQSSSQITIDDSAPTATLQPSTTVGGSDATFSVVYSDNIAVLASTIGTGDILVTGPNGYNQAAEIVSVDDSTDGTSRTATYRVLSPGNEWLKSNNGAYQILMVADQVSDTSDNFVPSGPLGEFAVAVPNQPPVADPGGPYSVGEGGDVPLSAAGSNDPDGSIVSYEWDFDNDGQYDDAIGASPTFSAAGLDGPIEINVSLKAIDDDGASTTDTATIKVTNLPPIADPGGPYTILEGGSLLLNGSGSSDPGNDIDTYEWDLSGDGAYEAAGESPVHRFDQPGTFDIALRVTDTEDASHTATVPVTVTEATPEDLGTVAFREKADVSASAQNVWYRLETSQAGYLTVEGIPSQGTVALSLYNTAREEPPLVTGSGVGAVQRFDYQVDSNEVYLVKVSGTSNDVDLAFVNLVSTDGSEITVSGTDEDDSFQFSATGSYAVTINSVDYHFDDTEYETIVFTGGEGDDTATLTGGASDEIARFSPNHGTFGENGFLVTVNDVVTITAHGGGGMDAAFMYDSPGDDTYRARKSYAKLSGDGFVLETHDFMLNYGYATTRDGGTDIAYMDDTEGNDRFKFDWPKARQFFGKMYSDGVYYSRAKNFEQIEAVMTEGNNTVRLFDSDGDDTFYGQKAESQLRGDGFDVTVSGCDTLTAYASTGIDVAHLNDSEGDDVFHGQRNASWLVGDGFNVTVSCFDYVSANASEGNDIAYLEDSDYDDTTRARPQKVTLWGGDNADPTYEIMARKFDKYHFEGKHGGFDRAKLHDTALNDHAQASSNSARVYTNSGELDLLYEVVAFEWVKLYGSEGEDTVEKEEPLDLDLVYDLTMWDEL